MSDLLSGGAIPTNRRSAHRAMPQELSRSSKAVWASFGLLALILAGYLVSLLLRRTDQTWTWLDGWIVCGVELAGSALCLARTFVRRAGRAAALILGLSLLAWTVGDIV